MRRRHTWLLLETSGHAFIGDIHWPAVTNRRTSGQCVLSRCCWTALPCILHHCLFCLGLMPSPDAFMLILLQYSKGHSFPYSFIRTESTLTTPLCRQKLVLHLDLARTLRLLCACRTRENIQSLPTESGVEACAIC